MSARLLSLIVISGLAGAALCFPGAAGGQTQLPTRPDFSSHTLVVVIPTERKKIMILSQSSSKRDQRALERSRGEQKAFDKEIRSAMKAYTYSRVAFIADSLLTAAPWLEVEDMVGNSQRVSRDSVWFLRKGFLPNGAEALILADRTLHSLSRPFPYFYKLNSFTSSIEAFFSPHIRRWRPLSELVNKMQLALEKYHQKYLLSGSE